LFLNDSASFIVKLPAEMYKGSIIEGNSFLSFKTFSTNFPVLALFPINPTIKIGL
jgi:hypothetical protein